MRHRPISSAADGLHRARPQCCSSIAQSSVTPATQETRLTVSVLICTSGRPEMLDRALTYLAAGSERPEQLVIVNGGDDGANDVVGRHAPAFDTAVLVQYANRNLSVSRNLGLAECIGDIIAITDDDAMVAPDWVAKMRAAHERDPWAGAVGGAVMGAGSTFLSRLADLVVFPSFPARRQVRTLPGVNVAYKREAVSRVGMFDEALFRGEDVDYNWRMIRAGYDLMYDPTICVRHEHRSTFFALLEQQWMYGRAYVLVRGRWRDMYCVYPHVIRTGRDWLKLAHCAAAILYQPAILAHRMNTWGETIRAYPLLLLHHATWKLGMVRQSAFGGTRSASECHTSPTIHYRRQWTR
jgi:GT2 family glycosyltransferase